MSIPNSLDQLQIQAYKESTTVANKPGVVCVNPDGTNIASATVTVDTEFPTAAALNGTWAKTTSTTISGACLMVNDGTNEILVSSGNGTAATAARVTLASDSTGQVVLAAGTAVIGSLVANQSTNLSQVNAATVNVGVGASSTGTQRVVTSTDSTIGTVTTVTTLTGTTSLTPGTAATNLGKAEDQASADGDVGVGALAIQKATPANTAGTDGDYSFLQMSAGRLWASSIITDANAAAFLSAANALNSTGAGVATAQLVLQFDDVAPTSITENQFGNARCSANRNLYNTIRDAAGNERGVNVDANNRAGVIGAADLVDNVAFTPAGASSYYTMMGAEADETAPASVSEGNGGALRMTLTRFLKVSLGDLISGEDQTNSILAMVKKPLSVTTYSLTWDDSAALEASSVSKASAGNLYYAFGFNNNAATRYIQFYNSTTVPADTTVPLVSVEVPANSTFSIDLGDYGKQFTTGIAWANSSTAATKTIGSADSWVNVGVL